MKYSVPTDFQDETAYAMDPEVVGEVYGKLSSDFTGGGRPSLMLPRVSRRQLRRHIRILSEKGISFNYLMNATCLGNQEMSIRGSGRLRRLLNFISRAGADTVTVAMPYLMEFIRYNYPELKVSVSVQAGVNSLHRAVYWESLGADSITLCSDEGVYRNFDFIRLLKEKTSCKLRMIANLTCLHECPFWLYHAASTSHASQKYHRTRGFFIDYSFMKCNVIKLENPEEFIRSSWIRPEDQHLYEEAGLDMIKFANRSIDRESLLALINSYRDESYDGNLLDLFSNRMGHYKASVRGRRRSALKYLFRPFTVNIFRLRKLRRLYASSGIKIDNKKLDGKLQEFSENSCTAVPCDTCRRCFDIAEEVLECDQEARERFLSAYKDSINSFISGDIFKYGKKKRKK